MKFKVVSDLHLEFMSNIDGIISKINNESDFGKMNLILTGDITTFRHRKYLDVLFSRLFFNKIFFILGNHEYYHSDHKVDVVQEYRNICSKYHNVIFLENDVYQIENGPLIVGATLWSNIDRIGYNSMTDNKYLSMEKILEKHNESVSFIKGVVENIVDKPILIITHHLPSKTFILPKYKHYNNTGFASDCDSLFKKPISHWIFGHTHTKIENEINGIKFICNPLGYINENKDYDYNCSFEYLSR